MNQNVLQNENKEKSSKSIQLKLLGSKIKGRWGWTQQDVQLRNTAWSGAAYGLILAGCLMTIATLLHAADRWSLMDFTIVFAIILVLGVTLAGNVVLLILTRVKKLPTVYQKALFSGGILVLIVSSLMIQGSTMVTLSIFIIVTTSLTGAGLNLGITGRYHDLTRIQKLIWLAGGGLSLIGLIVFVGWFFFWSGPAYTSPRTTSPAFVELESPIELGDSAVLTLSYGSGTDERRLMYGQDADLITESVDGSAFLDGWTGISGWYRTRFWGFDETNLPINGQVWYPDGKGPFPLVMIVHGAHNMADFSEGGYVYLGEMLASRGYITVSVDENFLNGGPPDLVGGLQGETDARAWMLLEHLREWHDWNNDPENPFYRKVDTEQIALVGHSRGGEAAAVATLFNTLTAYPDDATIAFDYGYNIRSVIGIAPTYGQYESGNREIILKDVNYLAFQGGSDGDNRTFMGLWQYENVNLSPESGMFKTAVYIHGANHGQFNTLWGASDAIGPKAFLLQRNNLMPAIHQEQIAKGLVSAFLDATLKGEAQYREFFMDPRRGQNFLPEALIVSQYADSKTTTLANFEEDIDPSTAYLPEATWHGEHLTTWYEERIANKYGDTKYGSAVVVVGWDSAENGSMLPRYTLAIPDTLPMDDDASLNVALAIVSPQSIADTEEIVVDFHMELLDINGNSASLLLSDYGQLFSQDVF